MRRERSLLQDIVDASADIADFTDGLTEDFFASNKLVRSAVVQKLMVIGEAASRLPAEFRSKHPEVSWRDVIAFRNILVHAYFQIDWSIVWIAAREEVPDLLRQILNMTSGDDEP